MSGLYTRFGMDFDTLFYRGNGKQTFQIFDDTGLDVGARYLAGDSGYSTGLQRSDGMDVGRLLGGDVVGMKRGPICGGKGDYQVFGSYAAAESDAWAYIDNYDYNRDKWVTCPAEDNQSMGATRYSFNYFPFRVFASTTGTASCAVRLEGNIGEGNGLFRLTEVRSPERNVWTFAIICQGVAGSRYSPTVLTVVMSVPGFDSRTYRHTYWVR